MPHTGSYTNLAPLGQPITYFKTHTHRDIYNHTRKSAEYFYQTSRKNDASHRPRQPLQHAPPTLVQDPIHNTKRQPCLITILSKKIIINQSL